MAGWEEVARDGVKMFGGIFAGLFAVWRLVLKEHAAGITQSLRDVAAAIRENTAEVRSITRSQAVAEERDRELRAAIDRTTLEIKAAKDDIVCTVDAVPCQKFAGRSAG